METHSENKEKELIAKAVEVFMTYGIKSVTMDDIARHLHVSKKTIYRYVTDKSDLVRRCIDRDCSEVQQRIEQIISERHNAIKENFRISSVVIEELRNIHPSIFYDLEKYYPQAVERMYAMRYGFIRRVVLENLKRGVAEGLYREDIHVEIMGELWVSRMNAIFQPSLFPMQNFHPKDVYIEMFVHHIRGIASEAGRVILDEKIEILKKEGR